MVRTVFPLILGSLLLKLRLKAITAKQRLQRGNFLAFAGATVSRDPLYSSPRTRAGQFLVKFILQKNLAVSSPGLKE
jgi:hypothetical protein